MANGTKAKQTFVVQIISQQHATVQGTITWAASGESRSFRSAMELMKLIDSVQECQQSVPFDNTKIG